LTDTIAAWRQSFLGLCGNHDRCLTLGRLQKILTDTGYMHDEACLLALAIDFRCDGVIDEMEYFRAVMRGLLEPIVPSALEKESSSRFEVDSDDGFVLLEADERTAILERWIEEPLFLGLWTKRYLVLLPGQLFTFDDPYKQQLSPASAMIVVGGDIPEVALDGRVAIVSNRGTELELRFECAKDAVEFKCLLIQACQK